MGMHVLVQTTFLVLASSQHFRRSAEAFLQLKTAVALSLRQLRLWLYYLKTSPSACLIPYLHDQKCCMALVTKIQLSYSCTLQGFVLSICRKLNLHRCLFG